MAELRVRDLRFNVVQLGPSDEAVAADPLAGHRLPVVFLHGLIMDNLSSFFYTIAPAVAPCPQRRMSLVSISRTGMGSAPASGDRSRLRHS